MIDLHIHTTCSDGQFTPEETMRLAAEAGVTVAAVTDHDTVSGISRARQTAQQLGMTFFSGIEISVQYTRELHILGYGIDADSAALLAFCEENARNRRERTSRMLEFLHRRGVVISLEDVRRCNQGRTSGRPHFARALVELGYAAPFRMPSKNIWRRGVLCGGRAPEAFAGKGHCCDPAGRRRCSAGASPPAEAGRAGVGSAFAAADLTGAAGHRGAL